MTGRNRLYHRPAQMDLEMNSPPRQSRPRPLSRRVAFVALACVSVSLLATSSGCSYYNNVLCSAVGPYEQISCDGLTELRGRIRARAIWARKYAKCYQKHCYTSDVRDGFVAGFVDACLGSGECPPMFAPKGACGIGLRKHSTAAWFEGYPLGAAAAESCGACRWVGDRCHPGLLACGSTPPCNPGCVPCQKQGMCGTCGVAGNDCECQGTGPIHVTGAPSVPRAKRPTHDVNPLYLAPDRRRKVQSSSLYSLPQVAPGETIVPGSIRSEEPLPASSQPELLSPPLPSGKLLPDDDTASVVDPFKLEFSRASLVEKANVILTKEQDEGIIQMVKPIQWKPTSTVVPSDSKDR